MTMKTAISVTCKTFSTDKDGNATCADSSFSTLTIELGKLSGGVREITGFSAAGAPVLAAKARAELDAMGCKRVKEEVEGKRKKLTIICEK